MKAFFKPLFLLLWIPAAAMAQQYVGNITYGPNASTPVQPAKGITLFANASNQLSFIDQNGNTGLLLTGSSALGSMAFQNSTNVSITGGSISGATFGNNTLLGSLTMGNGVAGFGGFPIYSPYAMPALAIDVTQSWNTVTLTDSDTGHPSEVFTFSGTPGVVQQFVVLVTNGSGSVVHTPQIPTSYSLNAGGNRTTFRILPGQSELLVYDYDGTTYWLRGDAVYFNDLQPETSPTNADIIPIANSAQNFATYGITFANLKSAVGGGLSGGTATQVLYWTGSTTVGNNSGFTSDTSGNVTTLSLTGTNSIATTNSGYTVGALPSAAPITTGPAFTVPASTYVYTGTNTATYGAGEYHGVATFSDANAGTITDAFDMVLLGPAAGAGAGPLTVTRGHTLGILDSTSSSTSTTGALVVASAFGTAGGSVSIGAGNINAGASITGVSVNGVSNSSALTTNLLAKNSSSGVAAVTSIVAESNAGTTKAVTMAYTSSTFTGHVVTNDPSGEFGILYTVSNTPLLFGTNGTLAGTISTAGNLTMVGTVSGTQLISTVSTGTAPLSVTSTTNVPNLNASSLSGATFAAPGPIGSGTASTGAFTTLSASSTFTLSADTTAGILTNAVTTGIVSSVTGGSNMSTLGPLLGSSWSNSTTLFLRADGSWASAGTGTVTGTGSNTQVAYWTGSSAIGGNSGFTSDTSGNVTALSLTGTNSIATTNSGYTVGALPSAAPITTGPAFTVPASTYVYTGTNTATYGAAEYHGVATFSDASAGTITDAFDMVLLGPAAGAGAGPLTVTRGHTLGILDSTNSSTSTSGAVVIASTFGTAGTSISFGAGNINAGATITGNQISGISNSSAATTNFVAKNSSSGVAAVTDIIAESNAGSTKAVTMAYTSSTFTGHVVTNDPSGEFGILYTVSNTPLLFGTNGTLAGTISTAGNLTMVGSISTAAPTNGAAAWELGTNRTSTALVVSTTNGLQVNVAGTTYTLAVLTTNP